MKTSIQNNVIFYLKRQRELEGYSQKRIATILGISAGQVGSIESLKTNHKYTLKQIWKISQLFHISIVDIFLTEEEQNNSKNIINDLITKIIAYEQ